MTWASGPLRGLFCALALFLFLALPAGAVTLPRLEGAIKVDGELSDPIWRQALQIDRFYDVRSGANAEPLVRTIVHIGYDSRFLYVAVRSEDPTPERIRAPVVPRDGVSGEQDMVQFDLDAQDDGKSSAIFRVNARGVQTDGTYTESTEVDDFAPDFDYETATKITADAWQVEMRIPLSSIRYAQRDPQTWRIVFYRVYPREQRYRFRSAPIEKGQTCWLCSAPRYEGISGLAAAGSLVVTPYMTSRAIEPARSAAERHSDGGADAKWLAGPSLSVDATFRPDFSQVEADVTELSINQRFAIFYPEKRPFFMEGADLLSSPIQAINTRTITSPSWGARVTGRPGNQAFTLIAAGDRGGGSTIVPGPVSSSFEPQSEALTILGRYRYSFGSSSAGLLATSRIADGRSNHVFGPDLSWWLPGDQRISAQLLWSESRDPRSSTPGTTAGHAALLGWKKTSMHLSGWLTAQDIGREFRADSGFLPQTGVRVLQGDVVGTAYPEKRFTSLQAGLAFGRISESDGGLVSQSLYPRVAFEGWRGTVGEVAFHPAEKLRGRDGSVESQDYVTVSVRFLPSRWLPYLSFSARTGEEIDISTSRVGQGTQFSTFARIQPAGPLFAELTATKHRLRVAGATLFDAAALNARLTWSMTPRSFVRIVGDGQRITGGTGGKDGFFNATVLYAYRLTWQTSIFAGYGDSRLIEEDGGLAAPRKEVFVKASYAMRSLLGGKPR